MRRQRQPALGMIGRAQPVKFPNRARQNAIAELIAFPPPAIPKLANVIVVACLSARAAAPKSRPAGRRRVNSAGSKPLRPSNRACRAKAGSAPRTSAGAIRRDFASARRCVCSRARGTSLPTAPAPSRRAGRGRGIVPPWLENECSRILQNFALPHFIQFAQDHATLAAQIFGQDARRIIFQPQAEFGEGRVQFVAHGECRRRRLEFKLQLVDISRFRHADPGCAGGLPRRERELQHLPKRRAAGHFSGIAVVAMGCQPPARRSISTSPEQGAASPI